MRKLKRSLILLAGVSILSAMPAAAPPANADTRSERNTRQDALAIATTGLGQNVATVDGKKLLLAGGHQFHDLWVRDFAMSVGGLLAISREDVVRDSLELIFSLQREDGLLPRVIDNQDITSRTILGSAFGFVQEFTAPLKGWFDTENKIIVIDGNAAIPWAASRYVKATRDLDFARKWFPAMEKSLAFLEAKYLADGLIANQPAYSDWEDSVNRHGKVALTNEFYLLALQGAADWAALLGQRDRSNAYKAQEIQVAAAFLKQFWDPVQKRILNFEGDARWTADANFLAVAYQLVPGDTARDILSHWPAAIWAPLPRTTWPDYADADKDRIVKLVGIADYHDGLYWLWLGAIAAMAERTAGDCTAYNRLLDTMAARISADQALYEVYELDADGTTLNPVDRVLYRAEQPFSWSSALLIEAEKGGCP